MTDEAITLGDDEQNTEQDTGEQDTGENNQGDQGTGADDEPSADDVLGATESEGNPDDNDNGEGDDDEGDSDVPESYADFALPDGMTFSDEYLASISATFKDAGLSQEQAQKIVTSQAEVAQANKVKQTDALSQRTKTWNEQSRADAEIGGDNYQTSVSHANKAVNQFGTPELKNLIKGLGIGGHPEVIRTFSKIGALLNEDQPGSSLGANTGVKKDAAEILYPDSPS